ncbi:reverse transcriptase family protein [Streptomyces sp. NPDC059639]|uniref:reverse transcriptase family protein n=1 Tax=Streptomyces sp. NPDC059639 TaxID=3346891 RepID=UPI0036D1FA63
MIANSPHLYRADGLKIDVPADLIDRAVEQAEVVESQGLAAVLTLNHLAHSTGASYSYLRQIVQRSYDPYEDISIPRRNGRKMRSISSPHPPLLQVQRWILDRVVAPLPAHPNSFAYAAGSSIKTCAEKHLGATWLVKLDIRNFFETINEVQVYKVFQSAGYQPLPSLEMARICTRYAGHARHVDRTRFHKNSSYRVIGQYSKPLMGFVPQGAPTSGALANQVARSLDDELTRLAKFNDMVYTRYADDIAISSSRSFDRGLALSIVHRAGVIMRRNGFTPHKQKTRIVPPGARKIILGLLVDGSEVRINRKMRARLVHHVRGVEKFGLAAHVSHERFSSLEGLVRHVGGLIAFTSDIEPEWTEGLAQRWTDALQKSGWTGSLVGQE